MFKSKILIRPSSFHVVDVIFVALRRVRFGYELGNLAPNLMTSLHSRLLRRGAACFPRRTALARAAVQMIVGLVLADPIIAAAAEDITPPTVVSTRGEHNEDEVIVEFNEPLDRASAEAVKNYRFLPCSDVASATLAADERTVTLTLIGGSVGPGLMLRVNAVKDRAGNMIAPNSTAVVEVRVFAITDGLIGHYRLDGNALDSSQRANHAAEVGSPSYVPGLIGQALSLNGTDQLAQAADPGLAGNGRKSVAVWFKQDAKANKGLFSFGDSSAPGALFELLLRGGLSGGYFWGDEFYAFPAGLPFEAYAVGEWQHAAITYDGKRVRSYLNGLRVMQRDLSLNTVSGPLLLGSGNTEFSSAYFNGLIDDVGLWNRALSPPEVSAIHSAGRYLGEDLTRPLYPVPAPSLSFSFARQGNGIVISFWGVLQAANDVNGPWEDLWDVCGTTTIVPSEARKFFRFRF